jgi:DNA-binding transcriptional LysR family regulator
MLDLRRLVVLEAVARCGSFTAAAAELSFSQSAVSQQIATLERETGTQLVVRATRRTWLTDAGQVLVDHARTILGDVARAEAELAGLAGLDLGTVRLAAFPSAGATLVPRAAAAFRRAHPGVVLELAAAEPSDGLAGVLGGAYDVALVLPGQADGRHRLPDEVDAVRLLDDPFLAVLPVGHPQAESEVVALGSLASEPWISTSSPGHPDADAVSGICAAAGFVPEVAFHVDDYQAVQGFIAARAGVALVPRLGLSAVRDDVVVRPVDPPGSRAVEAVRLRAARPAPAVLALLAALQVVAEGEREGA